MIFYSVTGKQRKLKNSHRYLINWDGKCRSKFQENVKAALRPYWQYDVVFEELPVLGTRLTIDLYNASQKIAIEVDGDQHYAYNPFFHGQNRQNFHNQLKRDDLKDSFCDFNDIN